MGDEELHVSGELHLIVASSPSKDRNCEALKVFPPARSVQIFSLLQRNVEETSVLQGAILAGDN